MLGQAEHPSSPHPKSKGLKNRPLPSTDIPEVRDHTELGNLGFLDPGCSPSTVCANIPKPEALWNRRPFCSRGLGAARPAPLHGSEQGRGSRAHSFPFRSAPQCCCGFHLGYEVPGELRGVCAGRVSAAGRGKDPRKPSAGPLPGTPKDTKGRGFSRFPIFCLLPFVSSSPAPAGALKRSQAEISIHVHNLGCSSQGPWRLQDTGLPILTPAAPRAAPPHTG